MDETEGTEGTEGTEESDDQYDDCIDTLENLDASDHELREAGLWLADEVFLLRWELDQAAEQLEKLKAKLKKQKLSVWESRRRSTRHIRKLRP